MYLTIVRHAIAAERDERVWPTDTDRPLTNEGVERFRAAARGLRNVAGTPELVLSSPLERCLATSVILTEEAGWPAPEPTEMLTPGAPLEAAIAALHDTSGAHTQVAIVGHEPNLSELITTLLSDSAEGSVVSLKKGGAARIDIDGIVTQGSGTLRWLLTPRVLRALA